MKVKKLFVFVLLFFTGFLEFNLTTTRITCYAVESSEDEDSMKAEDWKIVESQGKEEKKNNFKSIQKNEASKDEFLNDINIYYIGGLALLIIGTIGIICSVCSLFRIRKMKNLKSKKKIKT